MESITLPVYLLLLLQNHPAHPFLLPSTLTKQRTRSRSALSYYKPNLPLSSRLSEIQSELTNIKNNGLDKFFLDEISQAQKRLHFDVDEAEKHANDIVKKGRGDEGQWIRDAIKNNDDADGILNGLKGIRQELEEVRGVKELSGVLEETLKNDLMLENDLSGVTSKVATSLREAEVTIQSSLTELSVEISDDDRGRVLRQLDTTLKYINESIQTSNALATSVKKSTAESISILKRLTQSRNELTDAMKDTENTIGFIAGYKTETTDQGKKLLEDLEDIGDVAYEVVKEVESVEKLVSVLTTKVGKEADAILKLNAKTTEIVLDRLQSVIEVIKQSKSTEDIKVMSDYATKLKQQGELVEQYAIALQSDIAQDKSAQDVVKTANIKLEALLDAAESQAEVTKHAILTGDPVQPSYIEQSIVDAKNAILSIGDAAKTIADLAVDKIKSSDAKIIEKTKVDEKVVKSYVDKVTDAPVSKDTPFATKSEPDVEMKEIDSKHKVETKTVDQKEDSKVEAKSETLEPKDQQMDNSDSSRTNEFREEDIPREKLSQPKSEGGLNSPRQNVGKEDAESAFNASEKNVDLSNKEHTTSAKIYQPIESQDPVETSAIEFHPEMASNAHGTIESAAQVALLDTGDHFYAKEVGHDLATTALVSFQNLANVFVDSLWL